MNNFNQVFVKSYKTLIETNDSSGKLKINLKHKTAKFMLKLKVHIYEIFNVFKGLKLPIELLFKEM